jgi:hypothetical protein
LRAPRTTRGREAARRFRMSRRILQRMDVDLTSRGVNKGVWGKLGDGLFFLRLGLFYGSRHRSWKSSLPKIWTGNASMPRGLYALSLEPGSRRNVATLSRTISDAYNIRRPTDVCRENRTIGGRVRRVAPCYQVCRPRMLAISEFTQFVTSAYGCLFRHNQSSGLCS